MLGGKCSLLQQPPLMLRHKQLYLNVLLNMIFVKMTRLFVKSLHKIKVVVVFLDTSQRQPSWPCLLKDDHSASVDGNSQKLI